MKKSTEQRLIFLDILRGFFIICVLVMHAAGHLLWWCDETAIPEDAIPIWVVVVFLPFLLIATWAPIFALVSGASNGYVQYKAMSKHNLASDNPSPLNHIVKGLIYNGLVLQLVSIIHNTIIHFGYDNWGIEGAPQFEVRSLITGYLETGVLQYPSIEFLFYTDAISLIGTTNITIGILLFFLWRNNGFKKVLRNFLILFGLGLAWLAVSPVLQGKYGQLFFERLANADTIPEYLLLLPLKYLIGPPHSTFPNVAFGIFGLILGLAIAQKINLAIIKKYGFAFGFGFIGLASLLLVKYNLLGGNPLLSSDSVGTSLPVQLHLLNLGIMILLSIIIAIKMDYQLPEIRQRRSEKTVFIRRFSLLAMTIYMCESLILSLVMKIYVPLWGDNIQSHPVFYLLMIALLITISIVIWHIILIYWEKRNFKYSFEWFVVIIVGSLRGKTSDRLNAQKILNK